MANRFEEMPGGVRVFPIQIREDLTIRISPIPLDLTKAEAEKIGRILLALASDGSEQS